MPVGDIRLRIDFRNHPKTKRLMKVLGDTGVRCVIWLWLGAAARRPDGELIGWDAEEIEIEADWRGEPGILVGLLLSLGWLDSRINSSTGATVYLLHDWADEQPWVCSAQRRSDAASKAATERWEKRLGRRKKRVTNTVSTEDAPRIPTASGADAQPTKAQSPFSVPSTVPSTSSISSPPEGERVGPGGSVALIQRPKALRVRQPGDIAIVALAHEQSGLFDIDLANHPIRTRVEEWLAVRSGAQVALCYLEIARVMKEPGHGIRIPRGAIETLVYEFADGVKPDWNARAAGDGTTGRGRGPRRNGHDAASLLAQAARLEAEGK